MRLIVWILFKLVSCAAAVGVCLWLHKTVGPWKAMGIWTVGITAACVTAGLLLRLQPISKLTWIGRLAGPLLPLGYSIGRGKLAPIVVASTIGWIALGGAALALMGLAPGEGAAAIASSDQADYAPSSVLQALLLLFWLIDVGCVIYMAGVCVKNHMPVRKLITPMGVLLALIVISAAVAFQGRSNSALLLAVVVAGGLPTLLAVGYGLFVLLIVTIGRGTNWH